MKFACEVKTKGGSPYKTKVDAPNQGVAKSKALDEARSQGLATTGRVKAIKLPE